jgi:hypothetical protein
MQLFIRDGRHIVVEAEADSTVAAVKAAYMLKAYGTGLYDALVLLHNSKQLDDTAMLSEAGVTEGATLSVSSSLRGGGGDGGSTGAESRSCYLEMYAERKPDKVNPAEEMLARATRCRLSGERLQPPCVADELGSLFNKEALVHALLNKALPSALAHISSLKAVTTLKLDPIPSRTASHAAAGPGPGSSSNGRNGSSSSSDLAVFQCPVTGLEMNGRVQFVIHKPSGLVLSERALREVPVAAEELLGSKWTADDLIPVNPQGEELEKRKEAVAAAMAAERLRKAAKKAEKAASKAAGKAAAGDGAAGGMEAAASAAPVAGSKRGLPPAGPALAGAPAAASANGNGVAKKLKLPAGATPEVYASIFSSGKPQQKETYCCRSASGRGLGGAA